MPKKLEKELMKEGRSKGLSGDRLNAYIYGTIRKISSGQKKGSWKDDLKNQIKGD